MCIVVHDPLIRWSVFSQTLGWSIRVTATATTGSNNDSEELSDEQGQHNHAREDGCCSVPTFSSQLRNRRKHSSPQLQHRLRRGTTFCHTRQGECSATSTHFNYWPWTLAKRLVYNAVCSHIQAEDPEPLRMIVSGTDTGKSIFIHCLKALLLDHLHVMAPAAFNVGGYTLTSANT